MAFSLPAITSHRGAKQNSVNKYTPMAFSLPAITSHRGAIQNSVNKMCIRFSSNHEFAKASAKFNLCPSSGHHSFLPIKVTFKNSTIKWLVTPSAISSSQGAETSSITEGTTGLLDSVLVFDLNGNEVPISDLWKDRKAVVAFARHFGCVLCRKRADYLANEKDKMDEAGVALVLIGPGSVDQAKAFSEQTKFKGEVYADPSYSSYKALKFVSGVSTTFTSGAGLKIIQAYLEGYRQDWALSFEKDTRTRGGWQQGGIIVAGPGKNNISYIHKDKEAGDDPDIEDILKACCLQGG